jgi:FkbM family methyltransferase
MTVSRLFNTMLRLCGFEVRRYYSLREEIRRGKYRWLRDIGILSILDIGANTGQFAVMMNTIFPEATIHSFEPLHDCFLELKNKQSHISSLQCYNIALGEINGKTSIHRNEFTASSSILSTKEDLVSIFPETAKSDIETIEIATLDSMLEGRSLPKRILAKLDVQGYEMNVLRGAINTLPKVSVIIVETSFFELYDSQPLFREVYEFLDGNGFDYCGSFDQIPSRANGAILQQDAMFINRKDKSILKVR